MPEITQSKIPEFTGDAECPECFAAIALIGVIQNEIVQCEGCGVDLEVISLEPVKLALAPTEDEDWGE